MIKKLLCIWKWDRQITVPYVSNSISAKLQIVDLHEFAERTVFLSCCFASGYTCLLICKWSDWGKWLSWQDERNLQHII